MLREPSPELEEDARTEQQPQTQRGEQDEGHTQTSRSREETRGNGVQDDGGHRSKGKAGV